MRTECGVEDVATMTLFLARMTLLFKAVQLGFECELEELGGLCLDAERKQFVREINQELMWRVKLIQRRQIAPNQDSATLKMERLREQFAALEVALRRCRKHLKANAIVLSDI